jgi:hypothetical protein
MVYVILQHGMTFEMGYVTRGQYSDYYLLRVDPTENTITLQKIRS